MEPVLDSSRYFVIRVEGDGGKRAYVGMRFQERGDAFDFQVSSDSNPINTLSSILWPSRQWIVRRKEDGSRRKVAALEGVVGTRLPNSSNLLNWLECSTDPQVALQSASKRSDPSDTSDGPKKPAAPPKDYSLKDGQTFTIKIPGRDKKTATSSPGLIGDESKSGGGLFALPPPPPPGGRKR